MATDAAGPPPFVLRYDPEDVLPYGYFRCPQCEVAAYAGGAGTFPHDVGCPAKTPMEFWLGDAAALAILTGRGNNNPMAITAEHVRDAFPDLCRELEARRD